MNTTTKRLGVAGVVLLGASIWLGSRKIAAMNEEAKAVDAVIFQNEMIREIIQRQGWIMGIDEKGNSNYSKSLCITNSNNEPEILSTSFYDTKEKCDQKRPSAFVVVNAGEYLKGEGPVTKRIRESCAAMEGNPRRETPRLANCHGTAFTVVLMGPAGVEQSGKYSK